MAPALWARSTSLVSLSNVDFSAGKTFVDLKVVRSQIRQQSFDRHSGNWFSFQLAITMHRQSLTRYRNAPSAKITDCSGALLYKHSLAITPADEVNIIFLHMQT